ncbi:hypothetical protein G3580_12085 [Nitrogeniibacter mangrovi]|uniref:asparagine synthase (glutamine-hydrolyzing) n=1 Tax=Nitrogeniibacter mangrovi TaxID=2016596 RepID=A0A6C1B7M4_9RHOO|nr:asparagine synthase-related protein [Nitrogeniibacter mangrovi]QID18310.1 hypothetical protein G3580_12085 [Nitrogeniibacter mangrovi]
MDRFPGFACDDGVFGLARQHCRGFAGVIRPGANTPSLNLWHGGGAVALSAASRERTVIVTGAHRHGAALSTARQVADGTEAPATLTLADGGRGGAFVVHDALSGALVLGRDRAGIMPLYLSVRADRIAFATELGALAALQQGDTELDADVLAMYLDHGFSAGCRTPLAGVRRVAPGEIIHIDKRLQLTRQPAATLSPTTRFDGSFADAAAQFGPLFDAAVAAHRDPDQPCSLLLSGGLDSALICTSLTRTARAPVHTYAVAYDFTQKREELADARRIATLCGTTHTELRLSQNALWRHLPWTVWRTDELMDDHAALATSLAARQLPSDTAVFTGEGADDVFAGDGQYRRHAMQRWFAGLLTPRSGGWHTRGLLDRRQRQRLFGAALRAADRARRDDLNGAWASASCRASWLQRAQASELESIFPNTLALKVGRSFDGAAHSVHMPFLDPRVVRFGLALDDRLKVRARTGKVFLREWACARLPRDHVFKRKRGFFMPVSQLLQGERLDRLEPVLCASTFVAQWLNPAGVADLFSAHRATGNHAKTLWRLLQAAIWFSLFVVSPGACPTPSEDPLDWIL